MKKNWSQKRDWLKSLWEEPAAKAVSRLAHLFHNDELDEESVTGQALAALFKAVLWANGKPDDTEVERFEQLLRKNYSNKQVKNFVLKLKSSGRVDVDAEGKKLTPLSDEQHNDIIHGMLALALVNGNYSPEKRQVIEQVAQQFKIDAEKLTALEQEVISEDNARRRLIKSGAGILIALGVIAVFILTATLLKSVLFGLILAYIFLPLEKWYEHKLNGHGFVAQIFILLGKIFSPIKKIFCFVKRKDSRMPLNEEEQRITLTKQRISRATTLTVLSFVLLTTVLGVALVSLSANYVVGVGSRLDSWFGEKKAELSSITSANNDTVNTTNRGTNPEVTRKQLSKKETSKKPTSAFVIQLEKFKSKLEKLAIVQWAIEQLSNFMHDAEGQKQLLAALLKKSGGVFSITATLIGKVLTLLLNMLLTIFFFSLFLSKMALSIRDNKNNEEQQSAYLVKLIFNGKWLPAATEEILTDGTRIITEVIYKLKTWLRGYLSLMCIDFFVYSIGFFFLGVPYAPILGLVAAMGILLPYIGPFVSAIITIIVTLLVGGAQVTMLQLMLIVGLYIVQNGIIEQLFLYPAVIGESLGLSTLETIIVVLLGGIFAGVTGMIFAIPTAAVLKYLVPQIYRCLE